MCNHLEKGAFTDAYLAFLYKTNKQKKKQSGFQTMKNEVTLSSTDS